MKPVHDLSISIGDAKGISVRRIAVVDKYVDGFVIPLAKDKLGEYQKLAELSESRARSPAVGG